MTKSKSLEANFEVEKRIDDILGIINALKLISDVKAFRGWLVTHHNIKNDVDHFEGYKFAFNVLARRLHNEIGTNMSLGLYEDILFSRASFAGIPLNKIPNSCEKTILLKNMHKAARDVLKSPNWEEFETAMAQFENTILRPFVRLKSISIANPRYNLNSLNEAINYSTMFEVYIYLNDTSRGVPHGYPQSMLDNSLFWLFKENNDSYLRKAFKGYKYAIQFLWSRLLDEGFDGSSLAKMHKAASWDSLDKYFEIIRTAIIDPLERRSGANLGLAPLIILGDGTKGLMEVLLKHMPPEPSLNEKEQLEQLFLWYPIELVDASEGTLFNGVPAFVSALSGSIEIKKRLSNPEKTQVIRLIHPINAHKNYFSYGVLMEVTGLLSDASGWILFFDCCYNTGSGIQGLNFAEQFITQYSQKGLIEVRERQITKDEFLSLMKPMLISSTKKEMLSAQTTKEKLRNIKDRFDTSRGLLLELLAYYMYCSLADINTKVEWNYTHSKQQIDVIVKVIGRITFVECTEWAPGLIEDSKRLKEKADILCTDPIFCKQWGIENNVAKEYVVLVWDRPSPSIINAVRRQGVIIRILSEEINKHSKLLLKNKDKIRHVFVEKAPNLSDSFPEKLKDILKL